MNYSARLSIENPFTGQPIDVDCDFDTSVSEGRVFDLDITELVSDAGINLKEAFSDSHMSRIHEKLLIEMKERL